MMLTTPALDFVLPPELEAREPAELRGSGRDDVRLMVSSGDRIVHAHFRDLPRFLRPGDLLVLNTTATLPAALRALRENGEEIALHYSTSLPGGLAVVEPRALRTGSFPLDKTAAESGSWFPGPLRTRDSEASESTSRARLGDSSVIEASSRYGSLRSEGSEKAESGSWFPGPLRTRDSEASESTRARLGDSSVIEASSRYGSLRREDSEMAEPRSRGLSPLPAGEGAAERSEAAGEGLILPGGARARLLIPYRDSKRLWIAQLTLPEPLTDYLRRHGRPITYSYINESFPLDAYQTVYARDEGSAEMPSAGRAFTRRMLACLRRNGVALAKIVLHAGVASLESHERPYEEWYEVPLRTAERVREAKEHGGRVIAVGTTVVRALESSVDRSGNVIASRGWTDLVITPDGAPASAGVDWLKPVLHRRGVRVIDGLLTGFHEPRASHLQMLEAIAGREKIQHAYAEALHNGYLWHEFGDLHLIV